MSDSVVDRDARVPRDGTSIRRFGFRCTSRRSGLRCVNRSGHGFKLSRSEQTVL